MHLTILTIGSRGDVQPFIALALGLREAGYTVRLATHANFEAEIRAYGLEFALIAGNPQEAIQGLTGQATLNSRNPIEFSRRFGEMLNETLESALTDSWNACQGTDSIITSSIAFWGFDIAEALKVPCYLAALQPFTPTQSFPLCSTPQHLLNLGGFYNRLTYAALYQLVWQLIRHPVNSFRQSTLQLPKIPVWQTPLQRMQQQGIHFLHAFSPLVVPRPPDWSDNIHITGYWFLDTPPEFMPPEKLLNFLRDGSPPVYIGFGSMAERDPELTTEIALATLAKTKQRGILLTGWGGISNADLPDTIFKLESIPHDWLFPQMACVVHHGGAGTTAATFRGWSSGGGGAILRRSAVLGIPRC